jgi:hypothetical protein
LAFFVAKQLVLSVKQLMCQSGEIMNRNNAARAAIA